MLEISVTLSLSSQHPTSSMAPQYTDASTNNQKNQEAVTMQKQEQCIQDFYIKTGLEPFVDK